MCLGLGLARWLAAASACWLAGRTAQHRGLQGRSWLLVLPFLQSTSGYQRTPVHTFLLGSEYYQDAAARWLCTKSQKWQAVCSPSSRTTRSSRTRWHSASAASINHCAICLDQRRMLVPLHETGALPGGYGSRQKHYYTRQSLYQVLH